MEYRPNQGLNVREQKCPLCGGKDYAGGRMVVGKSVPGQSAVFRPNSGTWNDDDLPLDVRRCLGCGNVQFFAADSDN